METAEGRFQSFVKQQKSSKSSKSSGFAWPHPDSFKATPRSLAEAGFFFNPSKDDPDNVQCFICGKELGGWENDDDPFEIHFRKRPKCPWALARCSLEFDLDENGEFVVKDPSRLPSDKTLEKARLETFGGKKKWWPHDTVKGHGATSKLMAKAGFVYTPQSAGDDTATCFYCDLSLSGWDAEDDPLDEHRRREERSGKPCPYFHAQIQSTSAPEKEGKPKRASSKKPKSTKDLQPEKSNNKLDDDARDESAADEPPPPPVKKSARKPRTAKAASKREEVADEDGAVPISDHEPPPPKKSTTKKAKASKRTVSPEPPASTPVEELPPPKSSQHDSLASSQSTKPTKKAPAKAEKAKRSKASAQKNLPAEDEDDDSRQPQIITKPSPSRPQLTRKTSEKPPSNVDGKVARGYQDIVVDLPTNHEPRKLAKSDRSSRSRSRSRSAAPESTGDTSKSRSKSSKGKAVAIDVDEGGDVDDAMAVDDDENNQAFADTSKARSKKGATKPPSRSQNRIPTSSSSKQSASHDPESGGMTLEDEPSVKPSLPSKSGKRTQKKQKEAEPDLHEPLIPSRRRTKTQEKSSDSHDARDRSVKHVKPELNNKSVIDVLSGDESDAAHLKTVEHEQMEDDNNIHGGLDEVAMDDVDVVDAHPTERDDARAISDGDDNPFYTKETRSDDAKWTRNGVADAMDVDAVEVADIPKAQGASAPSEAPNALSEAVVPITAAPTGRDDEDDEDDEDIPEPIVQALSSVPLPYITSLTEEERAMTVEQWIRHEMAIQYEQLKRDGERWIEEFKERSREARKRIEAL